MQIECTSFMPFTTKGHNAALRTIGCISLFKMTSTCISFCVRPYLVGCTSLLKMTSTWLHHGTHGSCVGCTSLFKMTSTPHSYYLCIRFVGCTSLFKMTSTFITLDVLFNGLDVPRFLR